MGFQPLKANQHGDAADSGRELKVLLRDQVNQSRLPGMTAGYLKHGQEMLAAAAGSPDFEHQRKAFTPGVSFRVGSTTKMFTAALIARLAERGQLSLDEPIGRWFPGLPEAQTISVADLLGHRSGIEENLFTDAGTLMTSFLEKNKAWDHEAVVKNCLRRMKITPKGQRRFLYSNVNYLMLGLIAEKTAGKPVEEQLRQEFLLPLGLKATGFLPLTAENQTVTGGYDQYIPFGPHWISPEQTSWDSLAWTAGGMISSVPDLLVWLDAFYHGKLLKPETMTRLMEYHDARNNGRDESIFRYGMGMCRYEVGNFQLEGHPGGGFGGECFPFYCRELDTSVVVCLNLSRKDNPAGKAVLAEILTHLRDGGGWNGRQ